jgi:hypothetical protein
MPAKGIEHSPQYWLRSAKNKSQRKFGLDSGCPTGVGKVAGVNLEIHEEKWEGGAEVIRLRQATARQDGAATRRRKIRGISTWAAGRMIGLRQDSLEDAGWGQDKGKVIGRGMGDGNKVAKDWGLRGVLLVFLASWPLAC